MKSLMIRDYDTLSYINELYNTNMITQDEIFSCIIYDGYPMYGYIISTYGRVFSVFSHRELLGSIDRDGYIRMNITNENFNGRKLILIHRAVLMTFNPILNPKDFQVNHINGKKSDNRLVNLEWCTPLENVHHAWLSGLTNLKGDNHPRSVFSEDIIHDFCKRLEKGETYQKICDDYNIFDKEKRLQVRNIITDIINRETYRYISYQYNIPEHLPYERERLNKIGICIDDIYDICKLLEDGKSYREIIDIFSDKYKEVNVRELKELLYAIVSKKSYKVISDNYNIKKPKSEKEQLFTDEQIHTICKELSKGKKSPEILLNNFGIDIYSLDPKRKHCIINCVSNIKTKKQFKHISDLYF